MKNLSKKDNQDVTDRYHASEDEEESRFSQQSQLDPDEEEYEINGETDHVQVQKKDEIFVTGAKKKKVFYQQFHIAPEPQLFAPRGLVLSGLDKSQQQQQQQQQTQDDDHMTRWNVRVGDIVCMSNVDAHPQSDAILAHHRHKKEDEAALWFPFRVPWSPCQILSIYRERSSSSSSSSSSSTIRTVGTVWMEVRWLYRWSDIFVDFQIPKLSEYRGENEYEEVFETDHVSMDMPANSVIGRANLLLGTHCRNGTTGGLGMVPSVTLRCGLYFLRVATTASSANDDDDDDDVSKLALRSISMQGDIHMITNHNNNHNDTNNTRTDWWERVCHRGVEMSVLCAKYPELKRNTKDLLVEFESPPSLSAAAAISGDSKGTQTFSFGVIPSMPVVTKSDRIFYSSLSIRPPWGKYSVRKQFGGNLSNESRWTFRVGDVVAIQCSQSNRRSCATSDNDWGEQKVKWSTCQIVSIYEDIATNEEKQEESNTTKLDPTMEREGAHFRMEVRWMFRVSDFRDDYKGAAKEALQLSNEMSTTASNHETEMIFETDYLDNGFQAKDVLAPIVLLSRNGNGNGKANKRNKTTPVCFDRTSFGTPQEFHWLGKYFSVKHGRFRKPPKLHDFRQRAVELSQLLMKRDQQLILAAIQKEVYAMDERVDKAIETHVLSVKQQQQASKSNHARKRKNDARENDSVRTPTPKKSATKKLQTKSKISSKQAEVETKHDKGPKTSSQKKKKKIGKTSSEMAKAETKVAVQKRKKVIKPKMKSSKRALESEEKSTIVDSTPVIEVANEPKMSNPSIASEESSEESFLGETRVFQGVDPFYVDISSFNSFYTELKITPPYEHYALRNFDADHNSSSESWRVKLGDIVAVHYEDGKIRKNEDFTPFDVPSGIGEVVSIRKSHGSRHQALEIAKKYGLYKTEDSNSSGAMHHQNQSDSHAIKKESDFMLEIRWFYRKKEIHGITKSSFGELLNGELEEILETDEILSCSAYSLLAPCLLQESGVTPKDTPRVRRDMPLIRFQCHRFWSVHRKALVFPGRIETRAARGRMYSQFFGNDRGALKAALETELVKLVTCNHVVSSENETPLQNVEPRVLDAPLSWKQQFLNSIQALSLTDASAHVQVQGLSLPGREEERKRIIGFLRTAITGGMSSSDSVKSAIFIAGPPGTGKTASVRSIVTELRQEQAMGTIPEFNFIALNGIELRDPFDAYVKLWEALSGSEKDRRTPGVAAGLLEQYFTGSAQKGNPRKKGGAVTVLLLDEIDYLLTKKQTVLYNFFDWPLRASTEGAGSRLVVIGISNTINLPDRLQKSVESRMGSNRCIFQSYKVDDIVKILKTRLAERSALSVFDEGAITFAARKTAVLSGDIRKAFQICKGAAEYVMIQLQSKSSGRTERVVSISDVQKVSREMFSSVMTSAVARATSYEALLLISLASLARNSGREKGKFDIKELMTKMEGIASASGDMQYMPNLAFGDLLGLLNQFAEAQIVSLHTPTSSGYQYRAGLGGGGSTWPLISLPLEDFQIERALRNTPHQKLAEKHLGSVF